MVSPNETPIAHIVGLADLFHPRDSSREPADVEQAIFPCQSTMVISGMPGSGKTTFALSLVRSMMRDLEEKSDDPSAQKGPTSSATSTTVPKHIVYYISTEVNRERLKRMFEGRGWFTAGDKLFTKDPDPAMAAGLHIINPPLEIERPVKTSEDLVNFIVRNIAIETPPNEEQKVFIIVDSITALFKDCEAAGQARRQAHELIHRIHELFPVTKKENSEATSPLGMIFLLAEEGIAGQDITGMEAYVADFVIHLGIKSLSLGTRLRTLEIKKSQGQNLKMGKHTWNIVTRDSLNRIVVGEYLRTEVKESVKKIEGIDPETIDWGTIIIFRHPHFIPKRPKLDQTTVDQLESSGIIGLDEMLSLNEEYWFESLKSPSRSSKLRKGSVTIFVGEAGTGKTSLCYHVLAGYFFNKEPKEIENQECLLIGFENDLEPGYKKFLTSYFPQPNELVGKKIEEKTEFIFRSRSGLHFNLLLKEIQSWLVSNKDKPKRVAIDGISNLAATHTAHEFSQMLDALIGLFRDFSGNNPASVFLTYETAQTERFFASEAFRLPADNIVVLSHRDIDDQRRTAVTVLKSTHEKFDTLPRELVLCHENPKETKICSGFDAYSGLSSGLIKPAKVFLQLFHENRFQEYLNTQILNDLKSLLPYDFELRGFSRFSIAATLDSKETHIRVPNGDVKIESMDEWWISHKVAKMTEESDKADKIAAEHKLVSLPFIAEEPNAVIHPGDFWYAELEKVTFPKHNYDGPPKDENQTKENDNLKKYYAIPVYLDFGMLCVQQSIVGTLSKHLTNEIPEPKDGNALDCNRFMEALPWTPRVQSDDKNPLREALAKFIIPWAECDGQDYFAAPKGKDATCLVDTIHQGKNELTLPYGFAWDSRTPETAACFFYELSWAFGGSHCLFVANNKHEVAPMRRAFAFLGYLVYHDLSPECPTLSDTIQSVASRHYYSTLRDVNSRSTNETSQLCSLGFMPPGPVSWQSISTKTDNEARDRRLTARKKALEQQSITSHPNCQSPNQADIDELVRWQRFRYSLRGSNKGLGDDFDPRTTGHGCCGAWTIGVKTPIKAPGLAQVILEEVTSLKYAKMRAKLGAGIPARQDFYRFYGDRPVPGMEHFSWDDVLCYLGSRCQRRDRIYPSAKVDPKDMHQLIFYWSNEMMRNGAKLRIEATSDDEAKKSILRLAEKAVNALIEKVNNSL